VSRALTGADGEGRAIAMEDHVLLGARIAATLRDSEEPDLWREIDAMIKATPGVRLDLLIIALAAMVDVNKTPAQLVAWTHEGVRRARRQLAGGRRPNPREHGTERGYQQHRQYGEDQCGHCTIAHRVHLRPPECKDAFAQLVAAGVPMAEAADATTPGRLREAVVIAMPRRTG
jgi:hypothetical protein